MARNSIEAEVEDNGISLLEIIFIAFITGFWIGVINQVKKNEQLYFFAAKAGVDEFEQDLSKTEKKLSKKIIHGKKYTR